MYHGDCINVNVLLGQSSQQHSAKVCSNANYYLQCIRKIRDCVDNDTCKILVHSLVTSRLDYGNPLIHNAPQKVINLRSGTPSYLSDLVVKYTSIRSTRLQTNGSAIHLVVPLYSGERTAGNVGKVHQSFTNHNPFTLTIITKAFRYTYVLFITRNIMFNTGNQCMFLVDYCQKCTHKKRSEIHTLKIQ